MNFSVTKQLMWPAAFVIIEFELYNIALQVQDKKYRNICMCFTKVSTCSKTAGSDWKCPCTCCLEHTLLECRNISQHIHITEACWITDQQLSFAIRNSEKIKKYILNVIFNTWEYASDGCPDLITDTYKIIYISNSQTLLQWLEEKGICSYCDNR